MCAKQLVAAADEQEAVAIKKLARWMGQASSILAAFFPTRAMLFWTQRCVSRAAAQRGWRAATTISKSARDELCWWAEAMRGATWGDRLLLVDSESTEFVLETDARRTPALVVQPLQQAAAVPAGWSGKWTPPPALATPAVAELDEIKLLIRARSLCRASLLDRCSTTPPHLVLTTAPS